MLAKRMDALQRYMQAYRETIAWMYGEAAALDIYADYARLPPAQVRNVRDYVPKSAVDPGRIAGMGDIVADAVALKFITAPLNEAQTRELVRMPPG
jgi:NitT/TauT family transport system substrate-binding protein